MTNPSDEQLFVQKAIQAVEKAERYQKIKQTVVRILAFGAAFWLAFRPSSKELGIECTIIIFVGLIAAICTSKILSAINKNTKDILQAIISERQR